MKVNKRIFIFIGLVLLIQLSFFLIPKLYRVDINRLLPYTVAVEATDKDPEIIAYRIWFDLMKLLEDRGEIENAFFTRFTKIEEDEDTFVVAGDIQVQLHGGLFANKYGWGKAGEDHIVKNIIWLLTIEKTGKQTYTLTNIERSDDKLLGMPAIEHTESTPSDQEIEVIQEKYSYEITNDGRLKVTYHHSEDWLEVPVAIEHLFEGGYNGSKKDLIEGSYVITPEKTAFVLGGFGELRLLLSSDAGQSWEEVTVSDALPVVRLRLLGFTSQMDGYLIVTADKTMNFEVNVIFKTNDGGFTWTEVGSVEDTQSLVTDGGFVNNEIGFISFGSVNTIEEPPRPLLFRTSDGGVTWTEVDVPIPEDYKGIFTVAEVPTIINGEWSLLVNQGPLGDYLGGKVLARFTSEDEGGTWTFVSFVDPEGVLTE